MKILKGDKVKVLIGKDKGREGVVVKSFPKKSSVVVKDLNIFKKHVKPTQGHQGSIVEKERAIYISKVMLICPECKKTTRVGYKIDKSGEKYRICKKCQAVIIASVKNGSVSVGKK
ncbi:MAG: 50S ribosomal protein L24 [Candidatus Shapirobacteria bacterium]|jgi:large subunit ribosomal protein L24